MLVLTRQLNEDIIIAEGEIIIRVVDIRGDKVRLGITAPKDIPVNRGEVHNAILKERELAASMKAGDV